MEEPMSEAPEAWLRGPIEGVDPYLMPVAHALAQAREDLEHVADGLSPADVWARPGGAASIGFHLRHITGVLDRLLTYARGEMLSDEQLQALRGEGEPGDPPVDAGPLVAAAVAAIDRAIEQVRATSGASLLEPRAVGRKRLPSTVLGLLYHAAEHVTRHVGQVITTAKVVRGAVSATGRVD